MNRAYSTPVGGVNGWIKLHRQTVLNEFLMAEPKRLAAWIWLLLTANYEPQKITNKGCEMVLQPGELLASQHYLAKVWGMTRNQVQWFLNQLEEQGAIERPNSRHQQNDHRYHNPHHNRIQVIRLINWDKFQAQSSTPHQSTQTSTPAESKNLKEEVKTNSAHAREGFWHEQLNPGNVPARSASESSKKPDSVQHIVAMVDGELRVCDAFRAHWAKAFGGDLVRLQMALVQAAGYVQPNSPRPLAAQVGAQLARIAGIKRDIDMRAASNRPSSAQQLGHIATTTLRDTSEPFADYQERMRREGKI